MRTLTASDAAKAVTDHWGVGNLLSLMQQIGGWTPPTGTNRD
jgi:hypothetical protein